ncbi:phosphatase PAP2 family protein [Luteimonas sp. SJ-92]|uniref:undecaprenyl-diphosphate phosphatase n=1 Tax=Luteimonas salinisoli TaxID=2752307 RepID=A0A853J9R8_9GAMM|nr:phosphatase PAP2 family protein [Luteimonas salinisoli]NZA25418.1 phosphatase PAP2 family protein [Luteimonas salinisoli]
MGGLPGAAELVGHLRTGVREGRRFIVRHAWALALLFGGLLLPIWVFSELADEIRDAEAIVFDEPLLHFAAAVAHEGFDRVFLFFSAIGYAWGVVPADVALVVALFALRRYREGIFAAIALGGAAVLNLAAKQAFARDRPSLWESIAPEPTYSFPSGHAMGSAALALVLVLLAWPTRWRWPAIAAAAMFVPMVGLSRIYLGVHYPSDILAGWAAASIWVVGVYLMTFRRRPPFAHR